MDSFGVKRQEGWSTGPSLLDLGFGMALGIIALVAIQGQDVVWMWLTTGLFVVTVCFSSGARLLPLLFLVNVPYATGAWLAAREGIVFYPRPPLTTYSEAAVEQVALLALAAAFALLTGMARKFSKVARESALNFRNVRFGNGAVVVAAAVSSVLALHDLSILAPRLSELTSASRHSFNEQLWVGVGTLSTVVLYSASIILGHHFASEPKRRWPLLLILISLWAPLMLRGSRYFLSVLAISVVILGMYAIRSAAIKVALSSFLVVGGVFAFFVPYLWSGRSVIGFNEWILPQSLYLPLYTGAIVPSSFGVDSLWAQWVLLLPSEFRPYTVTTVVDVLTSLEVVNVGVGGNPWAEVFSPDLSLRSLGFVISSLALVLVAIVAAKLAPSTLFLFCGLFFFWGRSLFWPTVVMLIGVSVLVWLASSGRSEVGTRREGTVRAGDARSLGTVPAQVKRR